MNNYPEKKFASSTIEVNYAEAPGNGPPLVLIHGIGRRWTDWESVIDQFARDWHVFAVDLRGHGDSGRVADGYGFTDYPTELYEFLPEVVGQPAFLVGHSLGGVTAAGLCAVAPQFVAAAALEDPPLYAQSAPQFQGVFDIRNKNLSLEKTAIELRKIDDKASDEAILQRALAVTKTDPATWGAAIEGRMISTWKPDDILGAATPPVLLLQANPDMGGALSDVDATRADDLLENGRYVKWDDSGHGMHNSQPERFVQLVNAFFGQVLRQG
jgi:pimeloyl-ACP methyl ester carboxylesterase